MIARGIGNERAKALRRALVAVGSAVVASALAVSITVMLAMTTIAYHRGHTNPPAGHGVTDPHAALSGPERARGGPAGAAPWKPAP